MSEPKARSAEELAVAQANQLIEVCGIVDAEYRKGIVASLTKHNKQIQRESEALGRLKGMTEAAKIAENKYPSPPWSPDRESAGFMIGKAILSARDNPKQKN